MSRAKARHVFTGDPGVPACGIIKTFSGSFPHENEWMALWTSLIATAIINYMAFLLRTYFFFTSNLSYKGKSHEAYNFHKTIWDERLPSFEPHGEF